jgi:hypothetical protein
MNFFEKNSTKTPSIVPELVLVDLPGLPELIHNTFPLTDEDRDELLRQIFDHFLEVNRLDVAEQFFPKLDLLRVAGQELKQYPQNTADFNLLAQNLFALVYRRLREIGFDQAVELQGGFFYVHYRTEPDGHRVILKNLTPSLTFRPRYDSSLYP